ncbi:hypothetical protein [Halorussus lipolyticus]|uniref:hypothetical protein n=1 Tax=Halorussus lipolyticus TaxID=3034024 RepID=UPI0023E83FE3|nr:hypothetical protein [Halorussus sp. DT80]
MSLDVDEPSPPSLSTKVDASQYEDADVQGDDYRRDELEEYLEDGAWADAFDEWAAHTDLDEDEYAIAQDLDMFEEFDFFWDSFADRVGYHAPGIPEDWKAREYHPDIDSWNTVSGINAAMTEFGQIVCDVLEDNYIDWEGDYEAPDDLPDFET